MDDRRDEGRGGGGGSERGRDGGEGRSGDGGDRGGPGRGRDGGGARGTEFLDLEISKVLYAEAASLTKAAARELLHDAIKARLRERIGDRLDAIARVAADELVVDIEANLAIEARIAARREAQSSLDERVRDAVTSALAKKPSSPKSGGGRRR
jgi:hypothetical protein